MVDKTKAENMRKMGMTYGDISIALGCSESWCKQNLKGVVKEYAIGEGELKVKNQAIYILEEALAKLRSIG